jgi:hypothetical protein
MTITFLAPDGVPVTAQQFRQAHAALYGGGSNRRLGGRSGFRVDTPSNILTATSTTWTLTPCSAMIDPGATTHQGMYGWATDANETGSVTAADATNPRKDIVYIQVNDSSAGDGSGALAANVSYLAGTPGVTPVAPTLPPRCFLVGTITVPQAGGGSPTVILNPARFVSAGGILPVYSLTERDALTAYDSLAVRRMDIAGRPVDTHNGTAWSVSDVPWTDLTLTDLFNPAVGSGWTGVKYAVKSGWFIVTGAVTRGASWGADQRIADVPVPMRPGVKIQGTGVQVTTDGVVYLPAGGVATSFSATWPLF